MLNTTEYSLSAVDPSQVATPVKDKLLHVDSMVTSEVSSSITIVPLPIPSAVTSAVFVKARLTKLTEQVYVHDWPTANTPPLSVYVPLHATTSGSETATFIKSSFPVLVTVMVKDAELPACTS